MVRAVVLLASTAAAMETTGLLQATVGLHNQLASDKVASMRKMEKEWESKAMAAAEPLTQHSDGDAEIYQTILGTMDAELDDLTVQKGNDETALTLLRDAANQVNTEHTNYFASDGANFAAVANAASAHSTCRAETQANCNDMKESCNAKVSFARNIISDESGHNPDLCATKENPFANMQTGRIIDCQNHASAWCTNTGEEDTSGTYPATESRVSTETRMETLAGHISACNTADAALTAKNQACDGLQATFANSQPLYQQRHLSYCADSVASHGGAVSSFHAEWEVIDGDGGSQGAIAAVCHSALKVKKWVNVLVQCSAGACDGAKEEAIEFDPTDDGLCTQYVIAKPADPDAHNSCPPLPQIPELGSVCSKRTDTTTGYDWVTVDVM